MKTLHSMPELIQRYENNENIMQYLRNQTGASQNSPDDVLISYELQAGEYIKIFNERKDYRQSCQRYGETVADWINQWPDITSVMEAGIGEATVMYQTASLLKQPLQRIHGYDFSWSRLYLASQFLKQNAINDINLTLGDVFNSPFSDNSFDVIYTAHCLEANGGNEQPALEELFRICNKYLILIEPSYEHATAENQIRMQSHGYVKGLVDTARKLGFNVIHHEPCDFAFNELNRPAITIIEKSNPSSTQVVKSIYRCPVTHQSIEKKGDIFIGNKPCFAYPIMQNIPCLLQSNAILATKFPL
jgi:SAM-dependent methyltransferase